MAINKVEANGQTLIDLTGDTVTADTLVSGRTAHLASGEKVTGTFEPVTGVKGNSETSYRIGNVNLTPENIGALPTTGGTVTGNVIANGIQFQAKSTNIDRDGALPSSNITGNGAIRLIDKDGEGLGTLSVQRFSNGAIFLYLNVFNEKSDGTQVGSHMGLLINRDGTRTYSIADPAAFRTAIGLNNVNNTSDANKPISTATQAALDAQQAQIEDISDCLYIDAYNAGSAIIIQNTSDFTLDAFTKYFVIDVKPKFAFLKIASQSTTWYLRAMINVKTASSGTAIDVAFTDGTTLYEFYWNWQAGTLGTPTITAKKLSFA